jgi:hypothetical protein
MSQRFRPADRRTFIGGSDARIIMGADEPALLHLWREKRGEAEPEDLSGNLIVQLGLATENLNRLWYERNTGQTIECVQHRLRHPVLRWMGATLDGMVAGSGTVFEAKFMLPWSFSEDGAAEKHMAQLQHNMWVRDKEHRKFVSSQACLICGRQPSDPHHLRSAQPRALGRKVSDEFTVPLCRIHHREVHRGGDEPAWWNRFAVDPYLVAAALWAQTRPVRSVADEIAALPGATPEPTSVARRPNDPRNNKTNPIIAAGAQ